jgi:hypothetical protein
MKVVLHKPKIPRLFKEISVKNFSSKAKEVEYSTQFQGEGFSYRVFLLKNGKKASPWHDVDLE